jgi:hypothetical protein
MLYSKQYTRCYHKMHTGSTHSLGTARNYQFLD